MRDNLNFKKYGLSPDDVEFYRKHHMLPDKRTLKQLIKAYKSNYRVSLDDILSLEEKFGFIIDNDYNRFLLEFNGGVPSKNNFDNKIVVDYFLSIKSDYLFNSIIDLYDKFINFGIPIAHTPSGDTIILSRNNKIYLCNHNWDFNNESLIFLAESFLDFLNKLK